MGEAIKNVKVQESGGGSIIVAKASGDLQEGAGHVKIVVHAKLKPTPQKTYDIDGLRTSNNTPFSHLGMNFKNFAPPDYTVFEKP